MKTISTEIRIRALACSILVIFGSFEGCKSRGVHRSKLETKSSIVSDQDSFCKKLQSEYESLKSELPLRDDDSNEPILFSEYIETLQDNINSFVDNLQDGNAELESRQQGPTNELLIAALPQTADADQLLASIPESDQEPVFNKINGLVQTALATMEELSDCLATNRSTLSLTAPIHFRRPAKGRLYTGHAAPVVGEVLHETPTFKLNVSGSTLCQLYGSYNRP